MCKHLSNEIYLEETMKERKIVSIQDNVDKIEHEGIMITDISPLHALPGCDTISKLYSVGKGNPLSVLKKDDHHHLDFLDIIEELESNERYIRCVHFVSRCYNMPAYDTSNELHYDNWLKIDSAKEICPPLEKLPQLIQALENMLKGQCSNYVFG